MTDQAHPPFSSHGPATRVVPPRRRGASHILDAARYSLAGLARLWQEAAARLELTGGAVAAVALALHGASPLQWLAFAGLCGAVLALEALNTALEILCDRITRDWSIEIKHVKDLGSFAVGLGIVMTTGYVALVLLDAV